jgi:transposase
MRKQVNGLAIIAEEQMAQNPLSGAVFVFCNRQRRIIKALYWDGTGFALWQKKLESDRFPWPQSERAAREISAEELSMLLRGIDFWKAHEHKKWRRIS